MNSRKIEPICVVCGTALPVPERSTVICRGCGRASRVVLGIIDVRHPDQLGAPEKTALIEALLARFATSTYAELVNLYIEHAPPSKQSFQRRLEHNREYKLRQVERGRQFVHMFEAAAQKLYGADQRQASLEVGCGSGAALLELVKQFEVVVGIDPDLPSLILAQKALAEAGVRNVRLYQGYGQHLPFQPNTFDFIMAQNTLEHVFEVDAAIGEFKRVLAPGGVFVADSRNRFDLLFPEPHTGLHWVGMLPRAWAKKYVLWRTGIPYDHTLLQSYWDLRRALDRHFGRRNYQIRLPSIDTYGYSAAIGSMLSIIDRVPPLSLVVLQFFPSHLVVGHQPDPHQAAA